MLGKKYLIEHMLLSYNERQKEMAYKVYVTDLLQAAVNLKAKELSRDVNREIVPIRFATKIGLEKEDKRTGDEIAASIIAGAGLTVKKDG